MLRHEMKGSFLRDSRRKMIKTILEGKMRTQHTNKLLFSLFSGLMALVLSMGLVAPSAASAQGVQPFSPYYAEQKIQVNGVSLTKSIINGPSKPPLGTEQQRAPIEVFPAAAKTLTVPAFKWVFGCSAVSGAMIAGYYDRNGYSNMYTGPTAGGVMPLAEDATWGSWTDVVGDPYPNNPLIASHQGLDGRATKGSIDDYWVSYGSTASDPYITGAWTQHTWGHAIGDYMKTSQSAYGNTDGSTTFYTWTTNPAPLTCADMVANSIQTVDGTYGRKLFYEAKGYTVTDCYNQKTDNNGGGFTFANYKAQIDANRPVMLNLAGHTIVGVGYAGDAANTIYIHDTWDNLNHNMTWGGSYSGMQLLSVSIVNLQPVVVSPTPLTPSGIITDTTPTYTWAKLAGATQYRFQTVQGATVKYTVTVPATACGTSTCSSTPAAALPLGAYQWKVQAFVGSAWGAYSALKPFSITNVPILKTPAGTITNTKPMYSWSNVSGATQYQYTLLKGATLIYTKTVPSTACTATTCSNTPTTVLTAGAYTWKARAMTGGIWRAWSAAKAFTLVTGGFNSQFNGSAAGWIARPGGAWSLVGGTTYWTTGAAAKSSSTTYNANFSTLTYTARVKRVSSGGYSAGLVVRGKPTFDATNDYLNAYEFLYSQNGYFSVWKAVAGTWTPLKTWTTSAAIVKNGWNTLQVQAGGSTLKFRINGTLVWSGTDASHTTGQVGLWMYRDVTAERFDADWATLTLSAGSASSGETVEAGQVEYPFDRFNPPSRFFAPMK